MRDGCSLCNLLFVLLNIIKYGGVVILGTEYALLIVGHI